MNAWMLFLPSGLLHPEVDDRSSACLQGAPRTLSLGAEGENPGPNLLSGLLRRALGIDAEGSSTPAAGTDCHGLL